MKHDETRNGIPWDAIDDYYQTLEKKIVTVTYVIGNQTITSHKKVKKFDKKVVEKV
jgi:hypothetical protein